MMAGQGREGKKAPPSGSVLMLLNKADSVRPSKCIKVYRA